MSLRRAVLFFLFLFCSFPLASIYAEIIQLKNGNAIETKILREDDVFVTVEAPGGKVKIPKSTIRTIWRGKKEELLEVRGREVYFSKGVELYKDGQFKEAADAFQQALGLSSLDALVYANLGSAYAALGDQQNAEESFILALQQEPHNKTSLFNLAHFYQSSQKFANAAEVYQKILTLDPNDQEAIQPLAACYFALGNFQKSLELYGSLQNAQDVPILNNRAAALIQLGRLDEAESILKKLTATNTGFIKPFFNMAELCRVRKDYKSALFQYKIITSKEPKNIDAKMGEGRIYLDMNDSEKAENAFREALEIDPAYAPARYALAQLFIQKEEFPRAFEQYEIILRQNPKDLKARNELGLLYLKTDEPRKALESFQKTLEINNRYANGHANLGLAYAFLGDADKALEEWGKALELDPNLSAAAKNKKLLEDVMQGNVNV